MEFSHYESWNAIQMHFLTYFTLQVTLIMIDILHKVKDHKNDVRRIDPTPVLNMGESQKYARNSVTHVEVIHIQKKASSHRLIHNKCHLS